MSRWTGIVVASSATPEEGMISRLASYLHPIAGRPLIWHTVVELARSDPPPDRILVVGGTDISPGLFDDLPEPPIEVVTHEALGHLDTTLAADRNVPVVVVDASACLSNDSVQRLLASSRGSWLSGAGEAVAAARLDPQLAPEVLRVPRPLQDTRGVLTPAGRLADSGGAMVVRDRRQLAQVAETLRERIVLSHMDAGVSFLLPSSVLIDVDVRIGPDTVLYPGVVLEGTTTIGGETVIGPGCRVIDSWIGSGVELKGWNYVSHTSVRNRAILEPYVRRGFD